MPNIKISKLQKEVLIFFGQNEFGRNFYWTGGTLLAWRYLHHRDSVDLDFFSDNLFTDDEYLIFINVLKKDLRIKKITLTKQYNRRFYFIERGKEQIKLELVYFPFPAIKRRQAIPEFSLNIDSLDDIMVNKTLAAYQRNEVKDVFDLYYYLTKKPKYNIFQLINLVEKKFGVAIEPVQFLVKINELAADLDFIQPLLLNLEKNLTQKVKGFFQKQFNKTVKSNLI